MNPSVADSSPARELHGLSSAVPELLSKLNLYTVHAQVRRRSTMQSSLMLGTKDYQIRGSCAMRPAERLHRFITAAAPTHRRAREEAQARRTGRVSPRSQSMMSRTGRSVVQSCPSPGASVAPRHSA